ncbi:unnamed protein product [Schistocephalus solidus]|uniref:Uncharacterized protein n=1 Tax=Schistocephalus solidus TaxID=70667 RepID=A0A3P7DQW2_SCHSO|nr:unnamed protein product [Schistocephalus solidus]
MQAMRRRNVALDLPIFNALLLRRTNAGESANQLMALGSRSGLTPDETPTTIGGRDANLPSLIEDLHALAPISVFIAGGANV